MTQTMCEKLAKYLIPNWKQGWRMLSAQFAGWLFVWLSLPEDTQRLLIEWTPIPQHEVPRILALLALVGRFVQQPKVQPPGGQ